MFGSFPREVLQGIDFYAEPSEQQLSLEALAAPPGQASQRDVALMRSFAFGANQWPQVDGFRGAVEAHFLRTSVVGNALMDAMALGLGFPERHFEHLTDRSFWCARVLGYPPLCDAAGQGEVGDSVGEHTDYGCWTILCQDDTPGALQVRQADGHWANAEPIPGAFVVNLGDMLSVWTRGRFAATPHRVRQTQTGRYAASKTRPNARPTNAVGGGNPSAPLQRAMAGGALVYGEHLFAKVSGNFDFSKA